MIRANMAFTTFLILFALTKHPSVESQLTAIANGHSNAFQKEKGAKNTMSVFETKAGTFSELKCAALCSSTPKCISYNFNQDLSLCELSDSLDVEDRLTSGLWIQRKNEWLIGYLRFIHGFCPISLLSIGNPCASEPCKNAANCTSVKCNTDFQCACPESFAGATCEIGASVSFLNPATISAYAKFKAGFPALSRFSICAWYQLDEKPSGSLYHLLSYATNENFNEILIGMDKTGKTIRLYLRDTKIETSINPESLYLPTWLCFTWQSSDGTLNLYLNGTNVKSMALHAGQTIPGGGIMILGQDQDTLGGGFEVWQAFIGSFSQLNMWDYVLNDAEITAISSCNGTVSGNVLAWNRRDEQFVWFNAAASQDTVCYM